MSRDLKLGGPIEGHERYDAIHKARHLLKPVDDSAVRTILSNVMEGGYFYEQPAIDAMLKLEGQELKDEAALQIAAYFMPGIDTTDKRTWIDYR